MAAAAAAGPAAPGGVSPQGAWLQEAQGALRVQAAKMRRALDKGEVRVALRHCSAMLGELRTSQLSPQLYYALFSDACNELRHLEHHFRCEVPEEGLGELYETVQYAGNILPRLYLLVMAGSVGLQRGPAAGASVRERLNDMAEMCRGVQHPLRGLFLRSYLIQMTKDKLPGCQARGAEGAGGSPGEGAGPRAGGVPESVEFVLANFSEMCKLWVRLQHQGPARERGRRERERRELEDLVGRNLVCLSNLEGVDIEMYEDLVLPRVLEQVVGCGDEIAQLYLVDCLIQCFPDDFHLRTMEQLLGIIPQLSAGVSRHTLLGRFIERLGKYAAQVAGGEREGRAQALGSGTFERLVAAMATVVTPTMPAAEAVASHATLLTYATDIYGADDISKVGRVLESLVGALAERPPISADFDVQGYAQLTGLLTGLLQTVPVAAALGIPAFRPALELLDAGGQRAVVVAGVRQLVEAGESLATRSEAATMFGFLEILVAESGPGDAGLDEEDFAEHQGLAGRAVHLLQSEDDAEQDAMLFEVALPCLARGLPAVQAHVLPCLFSAGLRFVHRLREKGSGGGEGGGGGGGGVELQGVLQRLHRVVESVAALPGTALRALHHYLEIAAAADSCELPHSAHAAFEGAFETFDEAVADLAGEAAAVALLAGTLQACRHLDPERRQILEDAVLRRATWRVRLADRCRGALECAHLFWAPPVREDAGRVAECLERAGGFAQRSREQGLAARGPGGDASAVALRIEILNKYLYFFDRAGEAVAPASDVQELLDAIGGEVELAAELSEEARRTWKNTLQYVLFQKEAGEDVGARYARLFVPECWLESLEDLAEQVSSAGAAK